jgi:HEAT repeat protein
VTLRTLVLGALLASIVMSPASAKKKGADVAALITELPKCESLETCPSTQKLIALGTKIWPAAKTGLTAPQELTRFWTLGVLSEVVIKSAISDIAKAIDDPEIRVRAAAAYALGAQRDRTVTPHLIRAAADKDLNVRFAAVVAMGRVQDPKTIDTLIGSLRDKDDDVRGYAAYALGDIGDRRATERLCERLREDLISKVRGMSAMALGSLKDPASKATLLARLKSEDDAKALAAVIYATGQLRDPSTRAAIERHATHKSKEVREYVKDALKTLDAPKKP